MPDEISSPEKIRLFRVSDVASNVAKPVATDNPDNDAFNECPAHILLVSFGEGGEQLFLDNHSISKSMTFSNFQKHQQI